MKTVEQVKQETFGNVYTLEEFCKLCDDGIITSYDGIGRFHDGDKETDVSVWDYSLAPEDVWGIYPYVIWYNK